MEAQAEHYSLRRRNKVVTAVIPSSRRAVSNKTGRQATVKLQQSVAQDTRHVGVASCL